MAEPLYERRSDRTRTAGRDYTFRLGPEFGRDSTSQISEQIATMMSTTEKAIDLDSIRQRLDRLGVRL